MFHKLRVFWLALAIVLAPVASEANPKTPPRTVLDYFDLLPQRFFEIEHPGSNTNRRKELREGLNPKVPESRRSIIDLKNDYIRFPGGDAQGRLDIAVFRYKGQATVGVYYEYERGNLSFWRYQQGQLKEVTEKVFPFPLDYRNTYVLPRYGTAIRVFRGNNFDNRQPNRQLLRQVVWKGGKFQIRR